MKKEYKLWSINKKNGNKELMTMYGSNDKEVQMAYMNTCFKSMLEFKEKENMHDTLVHHMILDENKKTILDIIY